jgi:glycosyltransferase involved in cell wall biosynthesis
MRKVCLVTNCNYDKYLPFCLDSLVRQSVKFDVIYVVDDGSTDRSRSIIAEYAESFPEIVPLLKDNAGQLSCFNFVLKYLTNHDLVWLIDSDDYYPPEYVENFLIETRNSKSDFFFCKTVQFITDDMAPKTTYLEAKPIVDFGLTAQITCLIKCYIGNETSSLVVSGRLFKDIFPFPFESEWKTRADDVIIFASSFGSYSKTSLPSLCIGYRVHGDNSFYGRVFNREYEKNRVTSLNNLFSWYQKKFNLENKINFGGILAEYNSISSPQHRRKIGFTVYRLLRKYLVYRLIGFSDFR